MKGIEIIHTAEKGTPFYAENRVDVEKLPKKSQIKTVYRAIDLLKEGKSRQKTKEQLEWEGFNKTLDEDKLEEFIDIAADIIATEFLKKDEVVIGIHIERYNEELKRLQKLLDGNFPGVPVSVRIASIISTYSSMMDVMYQKEGLLQLHSKNTVIKVNQQNNIIHRTRKEKFDFSILSFDEKVELLNLITKTTMSDSEISGVILNTGKKDEVVIDIEHEEVKELNIDKIKQEVPPVPEAELSMLAIFELKEKMKKVMEQRAKEEFKKSGGKIDERE